MISSNSNMPAMPISPASPNSSDPEWAAAVGVGLTKREHFAGLAMQGLCSGCDSDGCWTHDAGITAAAAIEYADALLTELDKVQQ